MNLLAKLAAEEDKFLSSQFLAPVLRNQSIRVRIAGIVVNLYPANRFLDGWGVFKPKSYTEAFFLRPATMAERQQYLDLFPRLRLILCKKADVWYGTCASKSDQRFRIQGIVPVQLTEDVQLFDQVVTRYDGVTCWFDCLDPQADPRIAPYLREELSKLTEQDKIAAAGLTQEYLNAYLYAYTPAYLADLESKKDKDEEKIKAALVHAGAVYRSYLDRGDVYTVEYLVDGDRHRSTIRKENLQVESAGICLDGTDQRFDLTSLVSVIREGRESGQLVRVGDNR